MSLLIVAVMGCCSVSATRSLWQASALQLFYYCKTKNLFNSLHWHTLKTLPELCLFAFTCGHSNLLFRTPLEVMRNVFCLRVGDALDGQRRVDE